MRKEYGKVLRQYFSKKMKEKLPEFKVDDAINKVLDFGLPYLSEFVKSRGDS